MLLDYVAASLCLKDLLIIERLIWTVWVYYYQNMAIKFLKKKSVVTKCLIFKVALF